MLIINIETFTKTWNHLQIQITVSHSRMTLCRYILSQCFWPLKTLQSHTASMPTFPHQKFPTNVANPQYPSQINILDFRYHPSILEWLWHHPNSIAHLEDIEPMSPTKYPWVDTPLWKLYPFEAKHMLLGGFILDTKVF